MPRQHEGLVPLEDAAVRLGLLRSTLQDAAARGLLHVRRWGGDANAIAIEERELHRFASALSRTPSPPCHPAPHDAVEQA